jgi:adenylate kinase
MNLVQRFAAKKTLDTLATGLSALRVTRTPPAPSAAKAPAWIFLGPPGVGKGTYSSRVASALGVPHIAAGDLVRQQIKDKTEFGCKVSEAP